MKAILAVAFTLLVGLIFTAIAEIPDVHHDSDGLPDGIAGLRLPHTKTPESETDTPPPAPPSSDDVVWNKDKCRGQALLSAMTLNEANSSRMFGWPYTQSPWDGSKLAKWGYDVDVTHEDHVWYCDFITYNMNRAFEELMINIRPSGKGGPNHCFLIQHQYGSTVKKPKDGTWPEPKDQWYEVDGVWYRETGAFARVGINVLNGIVYIIHQLSPEEAAKETWDVETVAKTTLPQVRSSSDLTWAVWNRVAAGTNYVQNIRHFMSIHVNYQETLMVIKRAFKAVGVADGTVKTWPGTKFVVGTENQAESEAADALLGSPNGLAAGYFLLQHRRRLGGAKFIWKITVFDSDDPDFYNLQLLFSIDTGAHQKPQRRQTGGVEGESNGYETRIVKRSADGTSVSKEHVFWASL